MREHFPSQQPSDEEITELLGLARETTATTPTLEELVAQQIEDALGMEDQISQRRNAGAEGGN